MVTDRVDYDYEDNHDNNCYLHVCFYGTTWLKIKRLYILCLSLESNLMLVNKQSGGTTALGHIQETW